MTAINGLIIVLSIILCTSIVVNIALGLVCDPCH